MQNTLIPNKKNVTKQLNYKLSVEVTVLIFKGEKTLRHSKKEGKKVFTYCIVG